MVTPPDPAHEERYRAIVESAVDFAIIATDPAGLITEWNTGAERVIGWSEAEIVGQPLDRIFTPEDLAAHIPAEEMRTALVHGRAADERWHRRNDGRRFWASGTLTPLHTSEGAHLGFLKILRDRTEQHQAGADLREAKEKAQSADTHLQLALDAGAVVGSWVWYIPNDQFIADRRFARLFSVDPDAVAVGLPLSTITKGIHPDDRKAVAQAIGAVLQTGGPYRMEYRIIPGGQTRWIEAIGRVDMGADGKPVRFPGVLLDITERKRAEAARRLGHERFFETVNAIGSQTGKLIQNMAWQETPLGPSETWPSTLRSAIGICLNSRFPVCIYWGPDFVMLYNDPFSSIPGEKHPWALGRPARESWADIWPILDPMFNGIRTTGVAVHTEDGLLPMQRHGYVEECYFNYNVSPIYGEDGQVVGLFNAVIETTYRVIAERRAKFLRVLTDRTAGARDVEAACTGTIEAAASDPADLPFCLIYLLDPRGTCATLACATGLSPDLPASPSHIDLSDPHAAWPLAEVHRTSQPVHVTDFAGPGAASLILPPWPEPVHAAYVAPIANLARPGDLAGFLVCGISPRLMLDQTYRDVLDAAAGHVATGIANGRAAEQERRTAEDLEARIAERSAELARTQEALVQSQKMEAVGQLTGGLAHDFNNLLTGIIGNLDLLQTRVAQGRVADADRYVNAAQGAAKRAAALTHRLLAFSRRQTLDARPTDVNRLAAGMEELIRRTVGPEIEVETVMAGGLWTTLVDPGQLENALLNLCINGRDAMPGGGKLTIETGNKWLDSRAARDRNLAPGQYVTLCVSDNGTGMSPEIVARAFDPFFTTKPIGMGTGLGLSMIYGFTQQSGGQARIYSEVGKGTMVCLYLPRHIGAAEEAEPLPELSSTPRAEPGETVLVVDDEPTVRMLVREVLEDLGYTALEAADVSAGLKILRSPARIDLLVTDVGLPGGMNGRQLADAARLTRPTLKILFITGYAENAVLNHGHLDPGMHVLTKPFAMEVLANRIKALIDAP